MLHAMNIKTLNGQSNKTQTSSGAYERKSEQAHISHAPPLLENAVYNEWQFQALVRGNRTENQFYLSCTNNFGQSSKGI